MALPIHSAFKSGEMNITMDKNGKTIVIKVGTSTLTYENGKVNIRRIEKLSRVICDLQNAGNQVVLVSSGAIGVGVGKLGLKERPRDTETKQAVAAVGQCELMFLYDKLFSEYNRTVAQVLLTRDVIENEHYKQNVINTLHTLIAMDIIPIVNENDTVAIDELVGQKIGDNDTLSAIVAILSDAKQLIILTDIDGLYDSDPHKNPDAKLIPLVEGVTDEIMELGGGAGSNRGTGGMSTKLVAAKLANEHGIDVVIANGGEPEKLYDIADGKNVGTLFKAIKNA